MTISEWFNENGLRYNVEYVKVWQSVSIHFLNADGRDDETQFDVKNIDNKRGKRELENLYGDFCRENGFPLDTVQCITVMQSGYTYRELEESDGCSLKK